MNPARRILVTGPIGAGKTTFAASLGRTMGLPHVEIDPIFVRTEAWQHAYRERFRKELESELAQDERGWVAEGVQRQTLVLLAEQTELLIWLHYGGHVVFPRVIRRTIARKIRGEVVRGTDAPRWRDIVSPRSPVLWSAALWRSHQREVRALIRYRPPGMRVVILRSPREAERFLARAAAAAPAPIRETPS